MPECKYCGSKTPKYQHVCGTCYKKRQLIRELRAIVYDIKRRAEEEKKFDAQGISHTDKDAGAAD